LILYFAVFGSFHKAILNEDGQTQDLTVIGSVLYISVVKTVLLQILLDTYSFSWLYLGFMVATIKLIYAFLYFINHIPISSPELMGIMEILFTTAPALFNIFLTPILNA
jgi:hypothetical protein